MYKKVLAKANQLLLPMEEYIELEKSLHAVTIMIVSFKDGKNSSDYSSADHISLMMNPTNTYSHFAS